MNADDRLVGDILSLKARRQAVILAHNYQRPEVQDIADFVGDSLELSQQAAATEASVIVFCGVHFMAETAYMLAPDRTVLLPVAEAGCPMADMITVEQLRAKKAELPGIPVVCYVNSSAAVKAESDICCTSANAVRIVESLPGDEVIFVPDRYLGQWLASQTGKKIHLWPGFCPTHARILPEHITRLKAIYPLAKAVVHPECRPETAAVADVVLSTGGMIRYARREDVSQLLVGTETGIIHRLQKENPHKQFIPVNQSAVCPNMKLTGMEDILRALENMEPVVSVEAGVCRQAQISVQRMLKVG